MYAGARTSVVGSRAECERKSMHLGTAELNANGTERIDDGVWAVICSGADRVMQEPRGRKVIRTVLLGELAADKRRRKKRKAVNERHARGHAHAHEGVRGGAPQGECEKVGLTTANKSPCSGAGRSSWDATC